MEEGYAINYDNRPKPVDNFICVYNYPALRRVTFLCSLSNPMEWDENPYLTAIFKRKKLNDEK